MEEKTYKTVMHITRGCLVVPIHGDIYDELVLQIQRDILEKIKETGIKGVIIDLSDVDIIDSFFGQAISDTAKMASMLGSTIVLTGFKPGVVAALVDLNFEFKGIQTALSLEDGFSRLKPIVEHEEIEEGLEEQEKLLKQEFVEEVV